MRPACGREARETLGVIRADDVGFCLGGGGNRCGFGESIAGTDFAMEGLLQAVDQLGGRGSAAHGDHPHAGRVELAKLGTIEQRVGHGGDEGHACSFFVLNEAQHVGRIEAAHHDVAAALHGDALRTSPAVGVKQGDGVQLYVGVFALKSGEDAQRVHVKCAVREHDTFGCAGAAAGVKDFGDFVFIDGENIGTRNAVVGHQVFEKEVGLRDGLIDGDVGLDAGTVLPNFFDQRSEFAFENQHAGVGMPENYGKLRWLKAHVERHRDGSNERRAVVAFEKLVVVEAEIGDAVAGADAVGKQPGCETFATLSELGVGERTGAGDDSSFFSVKIDGAIQAPDGCEGHVHGQPGKTSAGVFQEPRWA